MVMVQDGKIIGQNLFMRARIQTDKGRDKPILTMWPICITPKLKRQGYGKILLDYSLDQARRLGYGAVFFEANIAFYGKSGFTKASALGIRYHGLTEGADASFFLGKELIPHYLKGITGEYAPPEVYLVDENRPKNLIKNFSPRKKKRPPPKFLDNPTVLKRLFTQKKKPILIKN